MTFDELAKTSARLAATRSRLEKKRILVELLARAAQEEVAAVVGWLVGEPLCGAIGVGPAQLWALRDEPGPVEPAANVLDVERALEEAAAAGHPGRIERVRALFGALTAEERDFLARAMTGSLRQGSLGGVMLLALAERAGATEADARRAAMLSGSLTAAARALLASEPAPHALTLFRPVAPMLAAPAESIEEAMQAPGELRAEWKVDGIRAQVHKEGARVAVYSRQGNDVTDGCTPLLEAFVKLPAERLVLDGEVVLVGADGRARPFQESFSALASQGAGRPGETLRAYFFDCVHRDGADLFDSPLAARVAQMNEVVPEAMRVPASRVDTPAAARAFYEAALAAGNEGVVVKDLASPYRFGARGRAWQKVKEAVTVDLVVLAVEEGSGRRKGFLSNIHLGARREDGTFCMVGKTFKGMTDAILRWQTERFGQIATERRGHVVYVRPEVVVEVRFNDVQRSSRYPGGVALRFARVVRYREDKRPEEADTLASLVARAKLPEGAEEPEETNEAKPAAKKQLSLF